jgi:hypothetical protein
MASQPDLGRRAYADQDLADDLQSPCELINQFESQVIGVNGSRVRQENGSPDSMVILENRYIVYSL